MWHLKKSLIFSMFAGLMLVSEAWKMEIVRTVVCAHKIVHSIKCHSGKVTIRICLLSLYSNWEIATFYCEIIHMLIQTFSYYIESNSILTILFYIILELFFFHLQKKKKIKILEMKNFRFYLLISELICKKKLQTLDHTHKSRHLQSWG